MTAPRPPIAIRADGGSEIGLGHIMRCAALAHALLAEDQPVVWLTRTPAVLPLKLAPAINVVALPDTENEAVSLPGLLSRSGSIGLVADWAVTDAALCARLRQAGIWLALVGNHTGEATADLFIRQRFEKRSTQSPACDGSEALLLGPRFARCPRRVARPFPARLLISLGGSRTPMLDRVLAALDGLPATEALTIDVWRPGAGGAPPDDSGLYDAMLAADLGILAAGTSLHEAAATGLPVIAIPIASNQAPRALEFAACGLGVMLDPVADDFEQALRAALTGMVASAGLRAKLSVAGQTRVDGQGASRVASRILAMLRGERHGENSRLSGPGAGKSY